MSAASLPYTLLIMLVELAIGSVAVGTYFDARRMVTRGYIQAGALVMLPLAVAALAIVFTVGGTGEIDGYALAEDWRPALRWTLGAFVGVGAVYLVSTFIGQRRTAVVLGGLASALGLAVLLTLAGLLARPAWSFPGAVASLLVGSAVLGGALMAMSWGHWYLTNSGLPKQPLEQMSLLVLGSVVVNLVLAIAGAALPVREAPLSDGIGVSLVANPAFWLRVGVGLLFPMFLATLAWKAASIRGMMSATGLLYIALGAVLAGELLARGLLFATGSLV